MFHDDIPIYAKVVISLLLLLSLLILLVVTLDQLTSIERIGMVLCFLVLQVGARQVGFLAVLILILLTDTDHVLMMFYC